MVTLISTLLSHFQMYRFHMHNFFPAQGKNTFYFKLKMHIILLGEFSDGFTEALRRLAIIMRRNHKPKAVYCAHKNKWNKNNNK